MLKNNDRSHSLFNIEGVRDINPEMAANYSGGISLEGARRAPGGGLVGGVDPDVILYSEKNRKGKSFRVNAATDDGIPNVGEGFNDLASSVVIKRGAWRFYENSRYNEVNTESGTSSSGQQFTRGPGSYNLGANNNKITGLKRIG